MRFLRIVIDLIIGFALGFMLMKANRSLKVPIPLQIVSILILGFVLVGVAIAAQFIIR